ncbi:DNA primase, partial [Enterococcus faecium]
LKQGKNLENEKDKIVYLEELLVELSRVVSPIEQDMYLSQLSTEFQVSRETIQKQLRELRRTNQQNRQEPQENQHTQTKRQETARKKRPLT